ncbi:MAG: RHS repeat-associated core domain-containing protein [Polyangiaceae bacterium]
MITGTMFTLPAIDFELLGVLPVQWARSYRTSEVGRSVGIGWGWSHPFSCRAVTEDAHIVVHDGEGPPARFPAGLDEGVRVAAPFGRTLERSGDELVLGGRGEMQRVLRKDPRGVFRLAAVRDGNGNTTAIEWTGEEVSAIVDCVGRRLERERHGHIDLWRAVIVGDDGALHRILAFSYELDRAGDLVRAVDSGGALTEYRYEDHYLVEERQPDGVVYRFRYEDGPDGKRRCVETWGEIPGRDIVADLGSDNAGQARGIFHSRLRYGPGMETTVTDAVGGVHRCTGNAHGLMERYIDPLGRETRMTFDEGAHLLSVTLPDGTVERTGRDVLGRITSAVFADGGRISFERDDRGRVTQLKGVTGARWRMGHDEAGKLAERVDPSGNVTRCKYNARGLPVETSGPGGKQTAKFDAHGNMVETVDVRGATWRYAYDQLGLPVRIETPSGGAYALAYDSRGDITLVEGPEGRRTEREYDAMQRLVAERHASGAVTAWNYVSEAPVQRLGPDGLPVRYGYDANLRLIWIENQAGERHENRYDAAGQLVLQRSFAGIERRYEYDLLGRASKRIGADGRALTVTRNPRGEVVARRHDSGSEIVLERDERGFIVSASNGQVRLRLERDVTGRVRRETQEIGGWQFVVEHEYDTLGYKVATRYSSGWGVSRRRGAGGALEKLAVHAADGAIVESCDLEYGAKQVTRRGGGKAGFSSTRDQLGRITRTEVLDDAGQVARTRTWQWGKAPGVTAIEDDRAGTRSYSMDHLGRVTAVAGLGVEDALGWSEHGAPVARSEGPEARVGRAGRKVAGSGRVYHWDALGRLSHEVAASPQESWAFAYDEDDQLVAAVRGDGHRLRYIYDPFGRRVAIVREDGTSTFFGWDGDSAVEEVESNGARRRYVFHDDGFTPLLDSLDGTAWRMVASDTVGTPWLYRAADGGLSEIDLGPTGADARVVGQPSLLRLAGQRLDVETGLRYQRHRFYSPRLGSFLSPDPMGLIGSLHDVSFVPNVTEFLDPLGLIIVLGSYDAESKAAADARAAATQQTVVRADALGPGGLQGHDHVEIITHGPPGGGQAIFDDGTKKWHTGRQLGTKLRDNHGLAPGAEVVVIACNSSMTPTDRPREGVIQGINAATGNPTTGPSGIAYVRPGPTQVCGCPPTGGAPGSVDVTTGHWDQATGGNGQPTTVTQVPSPSAHQGSWDDPGATPGHGVSHRVAAARPADLGVSPGLRRSVA